jgi:hypothetical protein
LFQNLIVNISGFPSWQNESQKEREKLRRGEEKKRKINSEEMVKMYNLV